jgi:hypothetical protein
MSVSERHSIRGEGVNAWCFDLPKLGVEALDITISQVITHDKNDIWSRWRLFKKFTNERTVRLALEPSEVIKELVSPYESVDAASL